MIFLKALEEKDGGRAFGGGPSRLASSLSRLDLMAFAEEVKGSFDKISSNVSPQLVFESLFCAFKLRWRFEKNKQILRICVFSLTLK